MSDTNSLPAYALPMNCAYSGCPAEAGDEWGHDHTAELCRYCQRPGAQGPHRACQDCHVEAAG